MSDLVKRLRDTADFLSRASHEGQFPHIPGYSAGTLYEIAPHCTEAADRIERLERYARHLDGCERNYDPDRPTADPRPCTCGLAELKAELKESSHE